MQSMESTDEVKTRPTRAKGRKGIAMEGVIARGYDKNARKNAGTIHNVGKRGG